MKRLFLTVLTLAVICLTVISGGCTAKVVTTTSNKPNGGAVVNSDSFVTAEIKAITKQSTGYPWKLDVLIKNTQDIDSLPNPVKDSVGKIVTVFTDENLASCKVNDLVTAKIKYVGDVNTPGGIRLYMYNIALK
jgi:hypothetical protein